MTLPAAELRTRRAGPTAFPGISVLELEHCSVLKRRLKEHFSISYLMGGRSEFWQRGELHLHERGSLLVSQPGDVHRVLKIHEPVSYRIIHIDEAVVEEARRALGPTRSRISLPPKLVQDSPEAVAFLALQRALFEDHDMLAQREALDSALMYFARLSQVGGRDKDALVPVSVRRAQEYMREELARTLSLDDIATEAGLDSFALIRAFRRHVGLSPYEWLTHLRVQRACDLLADGAKPSLVALQVGFYDQSQLHRHFRRVIGVTPGAYAKAYAPAR
jgi:AraC-like DNA-binding protein